MQPKIIPLLIGVDAFLDELEGAILSPVETDSDFRPRSLNHRDKFRHRPFAIGSWEAF
jgi:hypothetical protein